MRSKQTTVIEPNKKLTAVLGDLWEFRDLFYFLAWKDFKRTTPNVNAAPMPAPSDGLTVSGKRKSEEPLIVESISLIAP